MAPHSTDSSKLFADMKFPKWVQKNHITSIKKKYAIHLKNVAKGFWTVDPKSFNVKPLEVKDFQYGIEFYLDEQFKKMTSSLPAFIPKPIFQFSEPEGPERHGLESLTPAQKAMANLTPTQLANAWYEAEKGQAGLAPSQKTQPRILKKTRVPLAQKSYNNEKTYQ